MFILTLICLQFLLEVFPKSFPRQLAEVSGSGHGSGSSRSEENGGSYRGNDGTGGASGGGDRWASGSGHGCAASGSGGGSEGGDRRRDGGGADLECGGTGTNTKKSFKSFNISKMSIMLTAQTVGTVIASNAKPTPSSSLLVAPSSSLLVVALIDQLVGYLCGFTSILLSSKNPEAAKIFAVIGFVCTALGVILVIAMFLVWYLVLIVVLGFGGFCLIFLRNELKTPATEVWNYLKNSTQNLKDCIGMYFECGS